MKYVDYQRLSPDQKDYLQYKSKCRVQEIGKRVDLLDKKMIIIFTLLFGTQIIGFLSMV